jgi:ribosomal protein S18 acetylase RimI-like enzyme
MLTAGLDRLAKRGAHRLKVDYGSDAARALYLSAGFQVTATSKTYRWIRPAAA